MRVACGVPRFSATLLEQRTITVTLICVCILCVWPYTWLDKRYGIFDWCM